MNESETKVTEGRGRGSCRQKVAWSEYRKGQQLTETQWTYKHPGLRVFTVQSFQLLCMFGNFHNKVLGVGNRDFEMILKREGGRKREKKTETGPKITHLSPLQTTRAPTTYTNHRQLKGKSEYSLPPFPKCSQGEQTALGDKVKFFTDKLKVTAVKVLIKLENHHFAVCREKLFRQYRNG